MKKLHTLLAVILGLALLFAVSAPAFAQAKTPQDVIILKGNPMGGVKFMHTTHSKDRAIKCDTCQQSGVARSSQARPWSRSEAPWT